MPKTVIRQRRGCDLNPGPCAPESGTLTTRLPSHPRQCNLHNLYIFGQCHKAIHMQTQKKHSMATSCHSIPQISAEQPVKRDPGYQGIEIPENLSSGRVGDFRREWWGWGQMSYVLGVVCGPMHCQFARRMRSTVIITRHTDVSRRQKAPSRLVVEPPRTVPLSRWHQLDLIAGVLRVRADVVEAPSWPRDLDSRRRRQSAAVRNSRRNCRRRRRRRRRQP